MFSAVVLTQAKILHILQPTCMYTGHSTTKNSYVKLNIQKSTY